jgi:hypothetical protein
MPMFTFAEDQVSGASCRQRPKPMTAVAVDQRFGRNSTCEHRRLQGHSWQAVRDD